MTRSVAADPDIVTKIGRAAEARMYSTVRGEASLPGHGKCHSGVNGSTAPANSPRRGLAAHRDLAPAPQSKSGGHPEPRQKDWMSRTPIDRIQPDSGRGTAVAACRCRRCRLLL